MRVTPILVGLLGVFVLLVLGGAFFTVRETETVILTQFGRPVGDPITEPGLHWKTPFVQDVNRLEKRVLEFDGAATEMPTFLSTCSDMRARPCSRSACAISCPMTAATSSSVSCSLSRMPVKNAILPPGMQNALTLPERIRLTSHFQRCASWLKRVECGISARAMLRRRSTCRRSLLSRLFCAACRIRSLYCCAALRSTVEAGSSRRRLCKRRCN